MKAHIKKQWLEALRSGKYQQTAGFLRRSASVRPYPGHCCLGVLCDLMPKAVGEWDGDAFFCGLEMGGMSDVGLPIPVKKYVGLPDTRVHIPLDHPLRSDPRASESILEDGGVYLASLNDAGLSFAEIADVIEQLVPVDEEVTA